MLYKIRFGIVHECMYLLVSNSLNACFFILSVAKHILVNTLKISKPEKAQMVEGMICRMAQMGQLQGKLDDAQLVQLLESVNSQMPRSTSSVKFDRRRAAIDSDDDDDYGL